MKYRKIVSALMAAVLSVTGISGGTMLSASAETGAVRTDIVSDSEQLASSDNIFGSMLAADINEQQAQIQSGCVIYKAEMFGTAANVRFDTVQDGRIIVGLYEDPGDEEKQAPKLLGTGICDVTAEQKEVFVNIEGLDSVPDYYLIRAYLVSYSGALLSQEYENPMHTATMIRLLNSDINDYADYETLNLDDDINTNFIVYRKETTVLRTNGTENLVTEQDPEAGVYKISNYTGPIKTGSLVAIEGEENRITIFKIGSVSKSGAVSTIQADTAMDAVDALEYIKIDTDSSDCICEYVAPDESELPEGFTISGEIVSDSDQQKKQSLYHASSEEGETETGEEKHYINGFTIRMQIGKEETDYTPIKTNGKHNEHTVGANGGVEIELRYDYQYYQGGFFRHHNLNLDCTVDFNVEFYASFSKIIPIAGAGCRTIAGVEFHFGPYLYLSLKAAMKIGFSATATYYSGGGFSGDISPIDTELSGEFEAGFGLGVGAELFDKAQAHVDFMIGIRAEIMTTDKHNDCTRCMEGNLYGEITASAGIGLNFLKPADFEMGKGWELGGEAKLSLLTVPFYISDKLGFGWGECPNKNKTSGEDSGDVDEDDGLTAAQREIFKFAKAKVGDVSGYCIYLNTDIYNSGYISGKKPVKHLDMPDYYKGEPVILIPSHAFFICSEIESIKFPETLLYIDSWAFEGSGGKELCLKLPDQGVTIANSAFAHSRINELILPDSEEAISKINANAFYQATVNTVTIPNGVTVFNNTCLNRLYGFETVNFPATLTEIGDYAFFDCPLLNIEIPSSVKKIGQFAFALDSVHNKYAAHPEPTVFSTLTIPASVERIESGAFRRVNNINTIIIENGSKLQTKYSANCPFAGMANVTSLTLPQSWTEIPMDIACGLNSLKSVSIGTNVITVGTDAFRNTAISEINLPDTVQYINPGAFQGCKNLKQITIPSSVVKIGSVAFRGCESITEIVLPKSVKEISFDSMRSMASLNSVTFLNPNTVIDASWSTMNGTEWDDVYDCPVWNRDQLTIYGYTGSTAETFAKENNFKFSALSGKPETPITTTPGTTPQQPEEPKDEPLSITFTGLKPNTLYNFYDLLGTQFTAENLLYISQGVSDESGTLTVWYRPKADDTEAQKFVKCADPPPLYGDTNLDGFIDVADAVRLARYIAEDVTVEITDAGRRNGDCNHDGDISGDDCIMILMFIAKIITEI